MNTASASRLEMRGTASQPPTSSFSTSLPLEASTQHHHLSERKRNNSKHALFIAKGQTSSIVPPVRMQGEMSTYDP